MVKTRKNQAGETICANCGAKEGEGSEPFAPSGGGYLICSPCIVDEISAEEAD